MGIVERLFEGKDSIVRAVQIPLDPKAVVHAAKRIREVLEDELKD